MALAVETLETLEQIEENEGLDPEELQRQQTLAHTAEVALCFNSRHNPCKQEYNQTMDEWSRGLLEAQVYATFGDDLALLVKILRLTPKNECHTR